MQYQQGRRATVTVLLSESWSWVLGERNQGHSSTGEDHDDWPAITIQKAYQRGLSDNAMADTPCGIRTQHPQHRRGRTDSILRQEEEEVPTPDS